MDAMTLRRSMFWLGLLILLAAAVNVPMAVPMLKSRTVRPTVATTLQVRGAEAAALGWPHATPHSNPWPRPNSVQQSRAFGYRATEVWAQNPRGGSGFQMQHNLTGWPLPVFEQVQMWWPWDDPNWQSNAESDPAMSLHWPGLVFNPLILGGGAWLVLVFPFLAFHSLRRRRRRRRNECLACGYPIGTSQRCSECGAAVRPSASAPATAAS
jgi:hypothetical protein